MHASKSTKLYCTVHIWNSHSSIGECHPINRAINFFPFSFNVYWHIVLSNVLYAVFFIFNQNFKFSDIICLTHINNNKWLAQLVPKHKLKSANVCTCINSSLMLPIKLNFHNCLSKWEKKNQRHTKYLFMQLVIPVWYCMFSWQAQTNLKHLIFFRHRKRVMFAILRCLLFRIFNKFRIFIIDCHNRFFWTILVNFISLFGTSFNFRWNFGCNTKHKTIWKRANLSGKWNYHRSSLLLELAEDLKNYSNILMYVFLLLLSVCVLCTSLSFNPSSKTSSMSVSRVSFESVSSISSSRSAMITSFSSTLFAVELFASEVPFSVARLLFRRTKPSVRFILSVVSCCCCCFFSPLSLSFLFQFTHKLAQQTH